MRSVPRVCCSKLWLSFVAWLLGTAGALAGLAPENIFLVVNRASCASQTIANHYVQLRQIPMVNILYLDWTGSTANIDVNAFREKILGPILMQIERRGLADQIDAIVYSSDFPYQIDLAADIGKQQIPQQLSPHASITSATYLWQLVMTRNPNVIGLRNNQYVRSAGQRVIDPPSQGFRSWYGFGAQGEIIEGGGIHYMLSTMLAITSGRGNSVAEGVGYLRRSVKADGTRPKGTIYYCSTSDIRSKTRNGGVPTAIDDLARLGVNAEVVNGALPSGKKDVAGLMTGIADFSWPSAQSTILPGAICEHLTSFGGTMAEGSGQTPLSELLRYGAAGASGSVVEPYAMQEKFPLPEIQVHYARGCTLAESFYQSVFGPYQLLIVGDPLCRPWARIPQVTVADIKPNATLTGKLAVKATVTLADGKVDRLQMFLDGRRIGRRPAGTTLPFDTDNYADGFHELTVVGIDASPIEAHGRTTIPVLIDNRQHKIEITCGKPEVRWDDPIKLTINAAGLAGGIVFANGRKIEQFRGKDATMDFNARDFGTGPVTIVAVGGTDEKPPRFASSAPLRIVVRPNLPLPALSKPKPDQLVRGLRLKTASSNATPVQETRSADWLAKAGVKQGEAFGIEAYFDVPPPAKDTVAASAADVAAEGVHQFQIRYTGDLKLAVDSLVLHNGKDGKNEQIYLPVALAPGLHRLRIAGRAADSPKLQIRYGGEGTRSLDGERFRQLATP